MISMSDDGEYAYEIGLSKEVDRACHDYLMANDDEYAKSHRRRSAIARGKIAKRKERKSLDLIPCKDT